MAEEAAEDAVAQAPPARARFRRAGCWTALVLLALAAAALAFAWFGRERIAGNIIGGQLAARGIHATYTIEQIGTRTQILRDVVIGDPAHPDLTIERALVRLDPRLGIPAVGRITLVRPRLYGTYRNGAVSFGELDRLIFQDRPKTEFELPDLDLAIEDGRAQLITDFGPVGAKVTGRGNLQDGFAGELGAVAPGLALAGCESSGASLYGRVQVKSRKPMFAGPLRVDRVRCPANGVTLRGGAVQLRAEADEALRKFTGDARFTLGASAFAHGLLVGLNGSSRFSWHDQALTASFDLAGRGLQSAQAGLSRATAKGTLRARRSFERVELDVDFDGSGLRLGGGLDATLADAARSSRDTLLGPLLEQARRQFARESRDSALSGGLTLRRTGPNLALVVPSARIRGGSGETLLALDRFQLSDGPQAAPQFSGSVATGGQSLPRIVGTVALRSGGGVQAHLAMADYAAGASHLAVPELALVQRPDGALGFAGTIRASGKLPGGSADNLVLPVSGAYAGGRLALWRECTAVRFDRLQYASLTLQRQGLTLCPASGQPILQYGGNGLRLAVGAPALRLTGTLGATAIALRSGPVGFAYPGTLTARQLDVALGPPETAQRFLISDLTADVGGEIAGRFTGADARLFSVPIDVLGATGSWRYAGGRLTLEDAAFRVEDRNVADRFQPLISRDGTMTLADNIVTASATLREPASDRLVTIADIRHDLTSGTGHADLAVPGIVFDDKLQPGANCLAADASKVPGLSCNLFGVVANVSGTVTGSGRIDWDQQGVTSSGRFSSDALDFAAAFGPVKGASGTVEFSDLLGLTTAPGQRIHVASINPGVEVTDGDVTFELHGGQTLAVQGGAWPFMGGTLSLEPVAITFGASEVRRYVLTISGLDAARFIERMDLENISATGLFDGTIPVVFDAGGTGRVENGLLTSRAPGGNVAYVGALTYENMGTMANFAFDALRSLDYRQMRVEMNGNLTGEIITRLRFDGVSQGAGTKQNFITRQIGKLPFRFDVNIRASFYELMTNLKSLYDPAAVKDPRSEAVGLLDAQGNRLRPRTEGAPPPPVTPGDLIPDEAPIQRRESED